MARKPYPSDVTDEQWAFVVPYLTLMSPDAPQRVHDLREVLNAALWLVRSGSHWRMMPHDLPPWPAVYQQLRRWIDAGVFEAIVHDLRASLRVQLDEREPDPSAAVFDSRVLRSTPESGASDRAGYDGHRRTRGSKVHMAVDTLGYLLALTVTPADVQDRDEVALLAGLTQDATRGNVRLAYVDQGYSGEDAAAEARDLGIELEIVKAPEAKRGFVLMPRRWVVERSNAWMARCRRLARDFERLPEVLAGLHWLAFTALLLRRWLGTQSA